MSENNTAEIETIKSELNGSIDILNEKLKTLQEKDNNNFKHLSKALAIIVDGLNRRIDDTNNSINRWFAFTAIVVAISAPLLVLVIERFLK